MWHFWLLELGEKASQVFWSPAVYMFVRLPQETDIGTQGSQNTSVSPRVQSQRGRCKGHPHTWQWCNRAFERNQGLEELFSGLWLPLCTASCAHKGPGKVERAFCLSSPPLSCVSCPCVHTLPTLSPIHIHPHLHGHSVCLESVTFVSHTAHFQPSESIEG